MIESPRGSGPAAGGFFGAEQVRRGKAAFEIVAYIVLTQKANVKKLVATHFGLYSQVPAAIEMAANYFGPQGVGPEVWTAIVAEIKRGYAGPVVLAEDALVLRVGGRSESGRVGLNHWEAS